MTAPTNKLDGAMMTDDEIEALWRVINNAFVEARSTSVVIQFARALLSASKPAVPEGWKLVPVEPTDDMEAAAEDDYEQTGTTFPRWKSAYRAMLNAAPQPAHTAQSGEPVEVTAVYRASSDCQYVGATEEVKCAWADGWNQCAQYTKGSHGY